MTTIESLICELIPIHLSGNPCCSTLSGEELVTGVKVDKDGAFSIIKAPYTIRIFPDRIELISLHNPRLVVRVKLTELIPSQFADTDQLVEFLKVAGGCCCGDSNSPVPTDPENFARTVFVDANANGGAVGDGHKRYGDLAVAIAALGAGGGRVIVGAGTFVIGSPITLPNNVTIVNDPSTILESGGVIFEVNSGKSTIHGGTLKSTSTSSALVTVSIGAKLALTDVDLISPSSSDSSIKCDGIVITTDVLLLYTGALKPAASISQLTTGGGRVQNMSGTASNANSQSDAGTPVTCQDIIIDPDYTEPRYS